LRHVPNTGSSAGSFARPGHGFFQYDLGVRHFIVVLIEFVSVNFPSVSHIVTEMASPAGTFDTQDEITFVAMRQFIVPFE
jgi:hypothetical protein